MGFWEDHARDVSGVLVLASFWSDTTLDGVCASFTPCSKSFYYLFIFLSMSDNDARICEVNMDSILNSYRATLFYILTT